MNGKEHVRLCLNHQEADRVPVWELGFHNDTAKRLTGKDYLLTVGGGTTVASVLEANASGPEARRKIIRRIINDTMDFYRRMAFDLVRVRPTDFLTPFAFGSGNWSPNVLLDVAIQKIDTDCWKVSHPGGFWSIHKYNEQSQTLADVDDSIKQGGIDELRRYIEILEDQPLDLSIEPIQDALDGIRQAVEHPAASDIFVLGWGDVCYPGSTAHVAVFLQAMALEPELVRRYMQVTTRGILALVRDDGACTRPGASTAATVRSLAGGTLP